jgi:hypothetical protein
MLQECGQRDFVSLSTLVLPSKDLGEQLSPSASPAATVYCKGRSKELCLAK